MPGRITPIDRVPHAIRIPIQSTVPKRTQAVRAVESHSHRVELPIAKTQRIMPGQRVPPFTIEPEQAEQAVFRGAVTIGRVGDGLWSRGAERIEH
ncbi:hypothetical protein D3C86_1376810 [compost metagenome]